VVVRMILSRALVSSPPTSCGALTRLAAAGSCFLTHYAAPPRDCELTNVHSVNPDGTQCAPDPIPPSVQSPIQATLSRAPHPTPASLAHHH
jgi:hypothetical protein